MAPRGRSFWRFCTFRHGWQGVSSSVGRSGRSSDRHYSQAWGGGSTVGPGANRVDLAEKRFCFRPVAEVARLRTNGVTCCTLELNSCESSYREPRNRVAECAERRSLAPTHRAIFPENALRSRSLSDFLTANDLTIGVVKWRKAVEWPDQRPYGSNQLRHSYGITFRVMGTYFARKVRLVHWPHVATVIVDLPLSGDIGPHGDPPHRATDDQANQPWPKNR